MGGEKKDMQKKIRQMEMKRLLKRLGGEKMPTLMYQVVGGKHQKEQNINPW